MKITYLYNSGFTIKTRETLLVFDCISFGGGAGELSRADISSAKNAYFFVSHKHADHYDRRIYDYAGDNVRYILAAGTPEIKRGIDAVILKKGESYRDEILSVRAYGSTDLGVSYAVNIDGKSIFFAGDLNCWHWAGFVPQENERTAREMFTQELDFIKESEQTFDIAFFPVDPRMKSCYDDGAMEFIARFKPALFVPMHFRKETSVPTTFAKKANCPVFAIKKSGVSMIFEG